MVDLWYPKGVRTPEQRLRYYAARFDTVEVDSPFYAIPPREWARNWCERTPGDFIFHVKAYGLMTGHEVDIRSLPPMLADYGYEATDRGRVRHASPDMVDASFDVFLDAIEPLRECGKLGGVLMQYPPWFTANTGEDERRNLDVIEHAAAKLEGLRTLVEFRHPSWLSEERAGRTLRFLADRGLTYVSVDAPQFETCRTMPPLHALTTDWAYVRFHGRNCETYFKPAKTAADRFDYLYNTDELREWEPKIRELAADASETFVLFNNNRYDYAQRNAAEIATILGDLVPPRETPEDEGGQEALF
jgi:uncharacterized protein YecE (DUF72 family)